MDVVDRVAMEFLVVGVKVLAAVEQAAAEAAAGVGAEGAVLRSSDRTCNPQIGRPQA